MGKQPDQDKNQRSRQWHPCLKGHTLYGRLGARASPPDKGVVVPCIQFLWKVGLRPEILEGKRNQNGIKLLTSELPVTERREKTKQKGSHLECNVSQERVLLRSLSTDAAGQLHVSGHNCDKPGMGGTQDGVFKEVHQVGLAGLLRGTSGHALKAQDQADGLGISHTRCRKGSLCRSSCVDF
ncbi:hypothetical protein P7K49_004551 [Saguinus oedipus]|uniref:Uncharacterized protein n=1 Tax=Saguinus oedipus TaxID=9490 RepID=A0ABQ9W7S8_SAGOE|nr:hypothetical protein P7K49_004551 [Saguinus oedipus]